MSDIPPLFVHSDVDDFGLSAPAFRVLCHLFRRAGADGLIYSGTEDMAAVCRLEKKTVRVALQKLEEMNIVTTVRRPGLTAHRRINPFEAWRSDPTQTATLPKRHPTQRALVGSTRTAPRPPYPNGTHKGTPLKVLQEKVIHDELPDSLNTEAFKSEWERWLAHLRQKKCPLTPIATQAQLKKCETAGLARALAMIKNSIAGNYQSLVEPGTQNDHPKVSDFRPTRSPTAVELRSQGARA